MNDDRTLQSSLNLGTWKSTVFICIGGIYYKKFNKNFTPIHYLQPAILNR